MKIKLIAILLMATGCASNESTSIESPPVTSNTMSIIASASAAAPSGVLGEYQLNIKAAAARRGVVFLNTELDYRDQRCVTVTLSPSISAQLTSKYGQSPQAFFIDKSIMVKGQAKREKIDFYSKGKRTDKYYYQTHILVKDLSQIEVIADKA
ncbi:hypothetical protein Q4601_18790 [Shewanella sp. 1_MG-2023]|uniref:hypothetical protein n=1 Tax=unclassified Shewanella TaxID=196818 RepID=UPI0026E4239C|nr:MULTISPECIES: hypothetical protein [unclassified Shewanella]MDO6611246.1 hypothetical protein [Shewanella sp. 7_MG-2023]MDO6771101.1 hypothetical protein [Shewanella sp. 2_MG-2023]MDO6796344.1 hypothetical protein [Shewanella sp. 1_MG-2023]